MSKRNVTFGDVMANYRHDERRVVSRPTIWGLGPSAILLRVEQMAFSKSLNRGINPYAHLTAVCPCPFCKSTIEAFVRLLKPNGGTCSKCGALAAHHGRVYQWAKKMAPDGTVETLATEHWPSMVERRRVRAGTKDPHMAERMARPKAKASK